MQDWKSRKSRGFAGEELAAGHMRRLGFKPVARNWRPQAYGDKRALGLELDLVCENKELLTFVEVKTRSASPGSQFTPQDAFTPQKQAKLLRAVQYYLNEHEAWSKACRFDLICVVLEQDGTHTLEHYINVIECSAEARQTLGGGHAYWQPW